GGGGGGRGGRGGGGGGGGRGGGGGGRGCGPPVPKKGRSMLFGLSLISVLLAATAQITLKHGMTQVTNHGAVPLALGRPGATVKRVAANASVWLGLMTFVLSAAVWIVELSRVSLSFAYPF